jgi:GTP-binding protein
VNAEFIKSAVFQKDYPESALPEIAFVGRSNVGKSSMINSLLGRKKLVKVSAKPGKTRTLNFFNIDNEIMFVDLPGYGFAAVSKSERASWAKCIETYLTTRDNLKACVLILDIRRLPSEEDMDMLSWLSDTETNTLVVLTKTDKLSKNQIAKQVRLIAEEVGIDKEHFFLYSSVTGNGKENLWETLRSVAGL